MRNRRFRDVYLSSYIILLYLTAIMSLVSSDKGPNIIVLGAGGSGSGFSALGSGSSSTSSVGSGSMMNGGTPNILVLGGEGSGKKGDKKASVIIIMQPQPQPEQQQPIPQQSHQQPSHYQQPHAYQSQSEMAMQHPFHSLMHYPSYQDYYASSSMQPQMLARRGNMGPAMSSGASMNEESVLKHMNLPSFPHNMKGASGSAAGNRQWIAMSSEPYNRIADSVASPSDLTDYFSHSYGFKKWNCPQKRNSRSIKNWRLTFGRDWSCSWQEASHWSSYLRVLFWGKRHERSRTLS